jgi:sialate O-acetylesterase
MGHQTAAVGRCAGQSNMYMSVEQARNAAQEIAAARDLQIRHFEVVPHPYKGKPATEPAAVLEGGVWTAADSAHVGRFTAAGYFFARELRKSVDVPIGLLNVSVGGSAIVQWMSRETLRPAAADVAAAYPGYAPFFAGDRGPTILYNKVVHPLLSYPVKGILWYQGETEAASGAAVVGSDIHVKYRELFTTLIQDWRRAWNLGDLPFLFVQLPSFGGADTVPTPSSSWAVLRESQSAALRLRNTEQVVTVDLGEATNLHPENKQDVGARLALAARKVAYGEKIESAGPRYRRHTIQNGRVVLEFDHVGRGLSVGRQGGELEGFAIAGADRQFIWAQAKIDGDRVVVWSESVPKPVAVRYAWADNPDRANLYNQAGLPAAPFRTDGWPHEPRGE